MRPLRDADVDGSIPRHLDWLRDDLVMVYQRAIVDNTWSQLEADMVQWLPWAAGQLGTPRRRAVFGELLMNTGEGDVWAWLTRWQGLRPMDVGEDPNVLNAWESGALDPTAADGDQGAAVDVGENSYQDDKPSEQVYSLYQHDEPSETVYTKYDEND